MMSTLISRVSDLPSIAITSLLLLFFSVVSSLALTTSLLQEFDDSILSTAILTEDADFDEQSKLAE